MNIFWFLVKWFLYGAAIGISLSLAHAPFYIILAVFIIICANDRL